MEQSLIRLLKANEIECRIATINEKGLSLLLYKDARVDQRILDETFGAFGWKRSHQCIDGNLYCTVEIFDKESGEWVAKQDVGTTGYTEKEKSQASDSFKRACFNWGIGRELYSAPFIWVPAGKAAIQSKDNKFYCYDRFSVKSIAYNEDREISALVVENDKGQAVYELKAKGTAGNSKGKQASKAAQPQKESQENTISKDQMTSLQAELNRTGVAMEAVQKRYKIQEPEAMSEELYNKVMLALSRTKSAKAA
ncbi:MAG: hypothetical protein NC124_17475 [Clostridium sp.]|nr:hypothetical protein [Clostridium sp.]